MAMIGLQKHDRIVTQAERFQVVEHHPNAFIEGTDKGCVLPTWAGEMRIFLSPFCRALQGVMRPVDGPVNKERLLFPSGHQPLALVDHGVSEVLTLLPDLLTVAPEVVAIGAVPVKEMRVVVDASTHVTE